MRHGAGFDSEPGHPGDPPYVADVACRLHGVFGGRRIDQHGYKDIVTTATALG
jgi:hypothetical protein